MLGTEMVIANLQHSRGNAYDPDDLDIDDLRRPQLDTTEAITGGSVKVGFPV